MFHVEHLWKVPGFQGIFSDECQIGKGSRQSKMICANANDERGPQYIASYFVTFQSPAWCSSVTEKSSL
jgi:hypothetical protein